MRLTVTEPNFRSAKVSGLCLTSYKHSEEFGMRYLRSGLVFFSFVVFSSLFSVQAWSNPRLPALPEGMTQMRWSELVMADGQPPGAADVVVVPSDTRLLMDVSADVEGLIVMGEFFAEDMGLGGQPVSLTLGWSVVMSGGSFNGVRASFHI